MITRSTLRLLAAGWLLCGALPALAGGLAIVTTELHDNGDDDGYADTNETVELWLTVRNSTGVTTNGVTARIAFAGGRDVCVLDDTSAFGTVAPGATQRALDPIVFHVAPDRDRATLGLSPFDPFAVAFDVAFTAIGPDPAALPVRLVFDLDLDVTPGGTPATVAEDFETGLGSFEVQNLDFGLHDDADPEFGAADGWRCQYNEPYCTHASCAGDPGWEACSPGADAAAADAVWWSVDATRGRSGSHALYFGVALGGGLGFTTPTGVLEAAGMTAPIHVSADPLIDPTLSFAHQISLLDWRSVNAQAGSTADRAVVGVQLADASGAGVGPWFKIDPHTNVYDERPQPYANCTFDPVDDGSTGDDLFAGFDPWDDGARRGPSSTCLPEATFAWIGDTDGPFSVDALGNADGPGLPGLTGPGTWVESRFDLSRFRGRSLRVRFLVSTLRYANLLTWEDAFASNPDPGDDGWWIDDVTVEGARATAGTVLADGTDNSALPVPPDADGDAWYDACDGCPAIADPGQEDADGDGAGDVCDPCTDLDGDGFGDAGFAASTCALDNCPLVPNPSQLDSDADGLGDACDGCPFVSDPAQTDTDLDGAGDACDCAPTDPYTYPGAPEIDDAADNQCPGDADYGIIDEISGAIVFGLLDPDNPHLLSWPPQGQAGTYGVFWVVSGANVPPPATWCLGTTTTQPSLDTSATVPGPHRIVYYLVGTLTPWPGSLGRSSAGVERTVVLCN